ncbi:MAG: hypothetical protein HY722_04415 [Planctomycetes bacterium]|nr:hypothetical protein [Planctomycetota bacterium]
MTLTVRVYADALATAGDASAEWVEAHTTPLVPVVNGVFSLLLGTGTVLKQPPGGLAAVFPLGPDRFIGVSVNGAAELPERIRAASAAMALNALHAQDADRAVSADQSDRLVAAGTARSGDYFLSLDNMTSGTVKAGQIASGAVQATHIASGQINANHLASAPLVSTVHIAEGAVTGSKILDGSISTADLAANAVTTDRLAQDAVDSSRIANGSIVDADVNGGAGILPTKIGRATTSPSLPGSTLQDQVQDVVTQLVALQAAGGIRFVRTSYSYEPVSTLNEAIALPKAPVVIQPNEAPDGILILASAWIRGQQAGFGERESFAELRLTGSTRGDLTMGHVFDPTLSDSPSGGTDPYAGFCPSAGSGGPFGLDLVRVASTCVLVLNGPQWNSTDTNTIYWGQLRAGGSVGGWDSCRARRLVVMGL